MIDSQNLGEGTQLKMICPVNLKFKQNLVIWLEMKENEYAAKIY